MMGVRHGEIYLYELTEAEWREKLEKERSDMNEIGMGGMPVHKYLNEILWLQRDIRQLENFIYHDKDTILRGDYSERYTRKYIDDEIFTIKRKAIMHQIRSNLDDLLLLLVQKREELRNDNTTS